MFKAAATLLPIIDSSSTCSIVSLGTTVSISFGNSKTSLSGSSNLTNY